MKIDIVFPNKNEKKFIELAEKLGWNGLCFVYKNKLKENKEKIKKLSKETKLKLFIGTINSKNADLSITSSSEKDQRILEKSPPDLLFGLEFLAKKDPMHFRASGLNQVLCKLAKKNKVIIAIPLKLINESDIIIQVLDARFPEETRNKEVEKQIAKQNKKIIYVLNKSDLLTKKPKQRFPHIYISCKLREGSKQLRNKIKIQASKIKKPGIVTLAPS